MNTLKIVIICLVLSATAPLLSTALAQTTAEVASFTGHAEAQIIGKSGYRGTRAAALLQAQHNLLLKAVQTLLSPAAMRFYSPQISDEVLEIRKSALQAILSIKEQKIEDSLKLTVEAAVNLDSIKEYLAANGIPLKDTEPDRIDVYFVRNALIAAEPLQRHLRMLGMKPQFRVVQAEDYPATKEYTARDLSAFFQESKADILHYYRPTADKLGIAVSVFKRGGQKALAHFSTSPQVDTETGSNIQQSSAHFGDRFLRHLSRRTLKAGAYQLATDDSFSLLVTGLTSPLEYKLFRQALSGMKSIEQSYPLSYHRQKVRFHLTLRKNQQRVLADLRKTPSFSVEIQSVESNTITITAKNKKKAGYVLSLSPYDFNALLVKHLKEKYDERHRRFLPKYTEKEDNSSITRLNALPANIRVYASLSSRKDNDFYRFTPRKKKITIALERIGESTQNPCLQIFDGHKDILQEYKHLERQATRSIEYKLPSGVATPLTLRFYDCLGVTLKEKGRIIPYSYIFTVNY